MQDWERIQRVKDEAEQELLKIPGVTGVDIGNKYVNGEKTDTIAIRVYVERKRDVSADVAIPTEIQGIPTDVIERKYVLH